MELRDAVDGWRSSRRLSLAVAGLMAWAGLGVLRTPPRLPEDVALRPDGWADESTCASCHEQAESFHLTGHAHSLLPATDDVSRARLREFAESPVAIAAGIRVDADGETIRVFHDDGDRVRELQLDWCFGSGEHAHTWIGLLDDSWGTNDLVEFRWSWYHSIDGFDLTPGHTREQPEGHFGRLGVLHDHPKTYRCFACHSTRLNISEGRLETAAIHTGVTCQRCHGPRQRHVQSQGEIVDDTWQKASQLDAVYRCAQCHRRAEEQLPESITPENASIARFQPIGLMESACFKMSAMTCTTCHDPHRPMSMQDSRGIWQCVQCHDPQRPQQTTCAAGHRDDCFRCHMPQVRMEAPLLFTDHWIRVRDREPE